MEDPNSVEVYFKNKFRNSKWLAFQTKSEGYTNKTYINQDFYKEHRSIARKFRFNKRHPSKTPVSYEDGCTEQRTGVFTQKTQDLIYETAVPNTLTYSYEGLGSRAYNCQLTKDGSKILATTQCGTSFFNINNENKPELSKVILCGGVTWTITDSQLFADDRFLLHSTLGQYCQLLDVKEGTYVKELDLGDKTTGTQAYFNKTKIFSLDVCGNNTEFIVGCNKKIEGASVKIYDLEKNEVKQSVVCHKDDVNGVCYVEKNNPSLFISASDDGTSKIWDTRILKNNEPAGIFYGHVSGLTCVSSKDDGRHFITNSKDQSLKLWDIRNFTTQKKNHPYLKYDYRCEVLTPSHIQEIKEYQKKLDNSVMTFWGHQVHLTLIRCHFSPLPSTGQRYIYTGSFDGRVYIYDTVTGENVVNLEVPKENDSIFHCPVIRDCVWHPYSQSIFNTSFLGGIYRWEYRDLRDAERVEEETIEVENEENEEEDDGQAYRLYHRNNSTMDYRSNLNSCL